MSAPTGPSSCGFLLDLDRCTGCGACVLACRLENQLDPGVAWRTIHTLNIGRFEAGPAYHLSVACHHCAEPACLKACPTGAYEKREDGVVLLDTEKCLGCRYCEMACPFGAPAWDAGRGVMTKCTLCSHRLDRGEEPACVDACPMEALTFEPDIPLSPGIYSEPGELPGFVDPARCSPQIRFRDPSGERREHRLARLREVLSDG
ncbi:MAG: 4Fe-4S dicluster domain-containing protein [bacterium]